MTPIRVYLVEDHPAFRAGLRAMLGDLPSIAIAGEAANAADALTQCRELQPDIVLMDLRLPGISGQDLIVSLRREAPACRALVLTTSDRDEDIYRALSAGAWGYLLKDLSLEELEAAIQSVHRGERHVPPAVAGRLAERLSRGELTAREIEVLHLIVRGRSNKEIGAALKVSEETIKSRLKVLFVKLGVSDRTQAAVAAIQRGIVHFD